MQILDETSAVVSLPFFCRLVCMYACVWHQSFLSFFRYFSAITIIITGAHKQLAIYSILVPVEPSTGWHCTCSWHIDISYIVRNISVFDKTKCCIFGKLSRVEF